MRKSLSKKKRFKIFERDGFTCQYCGLNPNEYDVVLEVDHSISVKDGGGNEEENLVTSCFDCNRGKGKDSIIIGKLDNIQELEEKQIRIKNRLDQIKYIKKIKLDIKHKESVIANFKYLFIEDRLDGYSDYLIDQMQKRIKTKHIKNKISLETLESTLDITYNKFRQYNEFESAAFIKYFYGVLKKQDEVLAQYIENIFPDF